MSKTEDVQITVPTDEGLIRVSISRQALSKLSGRSHLTGEEVASAYRIEIEDIVRRKVHFGEATDFLRLTEKDFSL